MPRFHHLLWATILVVAAMLANFPAVADALVTRPLLIGHRGAPAYLPEHTLASYALAIAEGADFIEADLVASKDGVLIARHEPYLGGDNSAFAGADSTNVASHPEFAARKKSVVIDGVVLTGWFAEDFTLAELKSLRANERLPSLRPRSAARNGEFELPTLQEVIELVKREERDSGRRIGLYLETKHPTYHDSIGLSLEKNLLALLDANDFKDPSRVFIQSFEVYNLQRLSTLTDLPLVQLYGQSGRPFDFVAVGNTQTYDDLATASGLTFVATYADAVGPNKQRIVPLRGDTFAAATSFVEDAHAQNLLVHPYTFRSENYFLPVTLKKGDSPAAYGDHAAEYAAFFAAGIDGLFTDNVDHAFTARARASARPTAGITKGEE
jgi:glycerophosphoryl diester phosphodiesterase